MNFEDSSDFSKWDQQEIKKVYTSLAYLQGIQRLLLSQHTPDDQSVHMHIPATEKLLGASSNRDSESTPTSNADLETVSNDDVRAFPQPPSQQASSTKVRNQFKA